MSVSFLILNRLGFLQIGMAGGGGGGGGVGGGHNLPPPPCNFCLDSPIDLKFGM